MIRIGTPLGESYLGLGRRIKIRSITIENFRSFKKETIHLKSLNVLIGANASGKTNFVNAIQFLDDIIENGLENALSMHGGIEYIRNLKIGKTKQLAMKIDVEVISDEDESTFGYSTEGISLDFRVIEFSYQFRIKSTEDSYKVTSEKLIATCEIGEDKTESQGKFQKYDTGKLIVKRKGRAIKYDLVDCSKLDSKKIEELTKMWSDIPKKFISNDRLVIETPLFMPVFFMLRELSSNVSVYDFSPRLSKEATIISGRTKLEADGRNLPIALKSILKNPKEKDKISRLVRELLPFIEELSTEETASRFLYATMSEKYVDKEFLPAYFLSDGTMVITAIIIALYFESNSVVVIEEPGRCIHPHLISKMIEMMQDVCKRLGKQIIITTHNPELVRHSGVDSLLLARRNDDGFSEIIKPSKRKQVKIFLEDDFGLDELYIQNLLEWES